jgi:hypothetical protein
MKQAKLSKDVSNFSRIGSLLLALPSIERQRNNKMFKAYQK